VSGVGNVDLEQRIDELRQQKRKCQISKCKAEARLNALKDGGLTVECLEIIEQNLSEELEQQLRQQQEKRQQEKQRLEVTTGDVNDVTLSRTPSLRSTNISPDLGRISAMENKST
jgi:alpha-D-ribose 1-methylphosphonate 5-triphosphate synthase subunit PhnG